MIPNNVTRRVESLFGERFLAPLFVVSLIGVVWMFLLTQAGIGLGNDSAVYISMARNLLAGNGLSWVSGGGEVYPVTHFPPLFPLVLAVFEVINVDATQAARIVNSLAFGATILLAGLLMNGMTGSKWFSLLGSGLILSSIFVIRVYSWAMTEPLYFVLGFSGMLFLYRYLTNPGYWMLVLSGLALGSAYLTRYVGIAFVAIGLATLIINSQFTWKRRVKDSFLYLAVSLTPGLLWMVRNANYTGAPTSRALTINPFTAGDVRAFVETIINWFLPSSFVLPLLDGAEGFLFAFLSFAIGGGLFFWLWKDLRILFKKGEPGFTPGLYTLMALFVIGHLGILFGSILFITPRPEIHIRSLLPLHLTVIVMLVAFMALAWRSGRFALRLGSILLGFALLTSYMGRSAIVTAELFQDGQGYSSTAWRTSETMQEVAGLPEVPIYSNQTGALYLLAGRPAHLIPLLDSDRSSDFEAELESMRERMSREGAVLVLFLDDHYPPGMVAVDELTSGLRLIKQLSDGSIYTQDYDVGY